MEAHAVVTPAVFKLNHRIQNDANLAALARGAPEAALAEIGLELPPGIELHYAEEQGERRYRVTGLPNGHKTWIFGAGGGMRVESEPAADDELSLAELDAVAGGMSAVENVDRAVECCWLGTNSSCYPQGACGRGEALCYSTWFKPSNPITCH